MVFQDRRDAGRVLARDVAKIPDLHDAVVLGLPRGGVPVAGEVAGVLNLPLDILIVRKLGVPGQEELAMGAIASGGTVVVNWHIVHELGIPEATINAVAERERREIARREHTYRSGRPPAQVDGRTVILIDDGLATGSTMLAAVRALRLRARRIVVAVPVAAKRTCDRLSREADTVVCPKTPRPFFAVGSFYRDFRQTSDDEVRAILAHACGQPDMRHVA